MKRYTVSVVDKTSPTGYRTEERISCTPVVLVVWFGHEAEDVPPIWHGETHWHGLPLSGYFRWAIDYVVAGDERCCGFGPFVDEHSALRAYIETFAERQRYTTGFRLINEHCVKYLLRESNAWTDG